ncbi:MAG: hypothetical protein COB02_09790 [Candidatus Cloacimonadota bacterium]|nr:MAG: hypothetical protein COB02_09790 [Candidatus Cloacimonadota bacterium]
MTKNFIQSLKENFPDGKQIDESTFYLNSWNLEAFIKKSDDESFQIFLNFEFNLDENQLLILNKAKQMGLLGFHYYHPISLSSKVIQLRVLNNPQFKTQFVALCDNFDNIKQMIDSLSQSHIDMTMSAIESLDTINKKYQLI